MFPEHPYAITGRVNYPLYIPIITEVVKIGRMSPATYLDIPVGSKICVDFSIDSEFWPVIIYLEGRSYIRGWIYTSATLDKLAAAVA